MRPIIVVVVPEHGLKVQMWAGHRDNPQQYLLEARDVIPRTYSLARAIHDVNWRAITLGQILGVPVKEAQLTKREKAAVKK